MRQLLVTFLMFCLLVLYAGCKRRGQAITATSPDPQATLSPQRSALNRNYESGPARFDVCALLKREEIQEITGSSITETKGSGRSNGSFRISQCVYLASQPDQSVSLVVTQTDPSAPQKRKPKDFWREKFDRYQEEKEEKKEEGEQQEEGRPPRRIEGLGEEAFWTAGSLYVLEKDVFLRISIGGSAPEEAKLEHAKALAALAVKRL